MQYQVKYKIISEGYWLISIVILAALVEYVFIEWLDLHPVLSIKIQGLIGLIMIGYGIRMITRLWPSENKEINSKHNGRNS